MADELNLTEEERAVLSAVATTETEERSWAQEVSRAADLDEDRARAALASLRDKDLVVEDRTEAPGDPDQGPRYRVRQQPSP